MGDYQGAGEGCVGGWRSGKACEISQGCPILIVRGKSSGFGAKLFDMLIKVHVRGFEHCDD